MVIIARAPRGLNMNTMKPLSAYGVVYLQFTGFNMTTAKSKEMGPRPYVYLGCTRVMPVQMSQAQINMINMRGGTVSNTRPCAKTTTPTKVPVEEKVVSTGTTASASVSETDYSAFTNAPTKNVFVCGDGHQQDDCMPRYSCSGMFKDLLSPDSNDSWAIQIFDEAGEALFGLTGLKLFELFETGLSEEEQDQLAADDPEELQKRVDLAQKRGEAAVNKAIGRKLHFKVQIEMQNDSPKITLREVVPSPTAINFTGEGPSRSASGTATDSTEPKR